MCDTDFDMIFVCVTFLPNDGMIIFMISISFLIAKKNNGTFILRLDDTDPVRSKTIYVDQIKREIQALDNSGGADVLKSSFTGPTFVARLQVILIVVPPASGLHSRGKEQPDSVARRVRCTH